MAHPDRIPRGLVDTIADQLSEVISAMVDEALLRSGPIELAETLGVWSLGPEATTAVPSVDDDFEHLAKPTGRWHHQVRFAGAAEGFARSAGWPGKWALMEFGISPLAGKIDWAVTWADRFMGHDPLVRLLVVPAYQIHAFWFASTHKSNNGVLVLDQPDRFVSIPSQELLLFQEFIDLLRTRQPITGVESDRPDNHEA